MCQDVMGAKTGSPMTGKKIRCWLTRIFDYIRPRRVPRGAKESENG